MENWQVQLNIIKTIGKGAYGMCKPSFSIFASMSNSYGATHISSTGTVYLGTYNSKRSHQTVWKKESTLSIDDFIAEFEAIVDLRHQTWVQFFGVVLEPAAATFYCYRVNEKRRLDGRSSWFWQWVYRYATCHFRAPNIIGFGVSAPAKPDAIVHCDLKTEVFWWTILEWKAILA